MGTSSRDVRVRECLKVIIEKGYYVLGNVLSEEDCLDALQWSRTVKKGFENIRLSFGEPLEDHLDPNRKQYKFGPNDQSVIRGRVEKWVKNEFCNEPWTVKGWGLIRSEPHGGDQMWHREEGLSHKDGNFNASLWIPLMDGTSIDVVPGSCNRLKTENPNFTTLTLNAGEALIFRTDLVHRGKGNFTSVNFRWHVSLLIPGSEVSSDLGNPLFAHVKCDEERQLRVCEHCHEFRNIGTKVSKHAFLCKKNPETPGRIAEREKRRQERERKKKEQTVTDPPKTKECRYHCGYTNWLTRVNSHQYTCRSNPDWAANRAKINERKRKLRQAKRELD